MALTEAERAFMESGRKAGYSDDELVAKVKERRAATPSYRLTDYAGEAAKLPAPQLSEAEKVGIPQQVDDSSENPITRFLHRALPETRQYRAPTGELVPAPSDAVAHDPIAQSVIAGTLGAGAGALVGGAARPILAGAANAGTQAAVTGGDVGDIGTAALVGGAIPALGKAAQGIGNRIRNSEGGQARSLWEKHGGNVGPLDSGSGVEEVAGMEPSRANVGRASAIAAKNVRTGLEESFDKTTGAPYRAAREAIDYGPAGKEMVDVSSLRGTIADELYAERTPHTVRPYLAKELDQLDKLRDADGRVLMTQSRLNELKQRLQDQADYGINTGAGAGSLKDRSFKTVANAAKVLVDEGPYAEPNATYAAGMKRQAEDRAALGLRKRPAASESGRAVEDRRVAQVIRNRSNDSEAAGAMSDPEALAAFVERHPELARQLDLPDLVRAKGKLEFGLGGGKTHNLIQQAEHPTAIKKYLDLFGHNADALNGRFLYTPAAGAQALGRGMASDATNQIIAALAAQRELEQRRAEALMGR